MENLRGFKVQHVQATNNKPTRIKITDLRFSESVIIGYTAKGASEQTARAAEFLAEKGINITSQCWAEDKDSRRQYTILLTNNFTNQIK